MYYAECFQDMSSNSMLSESAKKKKHPEKKPEEKFVAEVPTTGGEGWFLCEKCTKNPERKCKICNCKVSKPIFISIFHVV